MFEFVKFQISKSFFILRYFENEEKKSGHKTDFLLKTAPSPASTPKVPAQTKSQEKEPTSQTVQHESLYL